MNEPSADSTRNSPHRILEAVFFTGAWGAIAAYLGAYLYAAAHDPWLTPRWTPYMLLWRRVGEIMLIVMHWMIVPGLVLVIGGHSPLVRVLAVATLSAMAMLLLICGIPV